MHVCDLAYKHGSQVSVKKTKWNEFIRKQQIDTYFDRLVEKTTRKNIMCMNLGDMNQTEKRIELVHLEEQQKGKLPTNKYNTKTPLQPGTQSENFS